MQSYSERKKEEINTQNAYTIEMQCFASQTSNIHGFLSNLFLSVERVKFSSFFRRLWWPVTEATPLLLKHPRSRAASQLSEVAGHCPSLAKSTLRSVHEDNVDFMNSKAHTM